MTVLMADTTRPYLIPGSFRYAMAYGNGKYRWTDEQIDRFAGHVVIGVLSGFPQQAHYCRELDVERYDASPSDVGPFVRQRNARNHHDATVYCDRSNIDLVAGNVPVEYQQHFRWHIATLDGTRSVKVPFGILWAVQYETVANAYDVSIVYGPFDWTVN